MSPKQPGRLCRRQLRAAPYKTTAAPPEVTPRGAIQDSDVRMANAIAVPNTPGATPQRQAVGQLRNEVANLERTLREAEETHVSSQRRLQGEARTAIAQQRHSFERVAQEYEQHARDVTQVEVATERAAAERTLQGRCNQIVQQAQHQVHHEASQAQMAKYEVHHIRREAHQAVERAPAGGHK